MLSLKKRIVWTVNNFHLLPQETGKCIRSPTFFVGINGDYGIFLELFPNGETADHRDHISLYMQIQAFSIPEFKVNYRFSLLNEIGDEIVARDASALIFAKDCCLGYETFIKRSSVIDDTEGLFVHDKLTVHCDVSFQIGDYKKYSRITKNRMQVSCDLGLQFGNVEFSDVTLVACGEEFPVHRVILASRSRVFSAMLARDRTESRVHVSDIEPEVLREVLRFVYCGNVQDAQQLASKLLAVADRYELRGLAELCELELIETASPDNSFELLVLAKRHSLGNLKKKVLEFIVDRLDDVRMKADCSNECCNRDGPNLADEFMSETASKIEQLKPS